MCFSGAITSTCTALIRDLFSYGFPRKLRAGPYGSYDKFSYFLINNALLYHFLVYWLAHNKKMTEKSVFRDARTPEMTSQSFPVSCFWSRGFVPHRKWNLMLLVHQDTGKENRYRKIFLLHLSAHWGDLIEQIKKSVIYALRTQHHCSFHCSLYVCNFGVFTLRTK